ncbi:rhodanese-like domain-containing protein [Mesoterricola silvestris]|uniref:rhodanese-like domain-containing protein n=1 Tax=Mesoterricola silvestris TaxID=2927979 RepID=UPI003744623B
MIAHGQHKCSRALPGWPSPFTSEQKGKVIQGLWFLSPQEALDALRGGGLLVDLRSDELVQMQAFGVPESLHLPHPIAAEQGSDFPMDRLLVLADSSGVYTKAAAAVLMAHRYHQLALLNGGMLAWDQAGLPVATDAGSLLHGECACVMRPRKDRSSTSRSTEPQWPRPASCSFAWPTVPAPRWPRASPGNSSPDGASRVREAGQAR